MSIKSRIFSKVSGDDDTSKPEIDPDKKKFLPKTAEESDDDESRIDFSYEEIEAHVQNGKEVRSLGIPEEDELDKDIETYAGSWPQNIIESRLTRPEDPTWLGYSEDGTKGLTPQGIKFDTLFQHNAFFGATGTGKSTLLKNIMLQWINSGYGVCFLDMHGKDSRELLQSIPPDRIDDVIWVEPGGDKEKEVGFNFFEPSSDRGTSEFTQEVRRITANMTDMLDLDNGNRMKNITAGIIQQLAKAEENFTPIEFYKILSDEEEREYLAEEFGNSFEKPFLEQISEMDDEALDHVRRHVREWVEDPQIRQIVARRESSVHIEQAIEQGKILILDYEHVNDEDLIQTISNTIFNRIWSSVQKRSNQSTSNYTPYFIVIDEFAAVEYDGMNLKEMLAQARKFGLSLTICTQQPNQIEHEKNLQAVNNNCRNYFTFRVGSNNNKMAREIAKSLPGISATTLQEIDDYLAVGKLVGENDETETVPINTFAPYPPIRSKHEVENIIKQSVRKYGTEFNTEAEQGLDAFSIKNVLSDGESSVDPEEQERKLLEGDKGTQITEPQLYTSIHTAGIREGRSTFNNHEDWVEYKAIRNEVDRYLDPDEKIPDPTFANVIEKLPETHVKSYMEGGSMYFRLTADGERVAIDPGTGSGGASGKIRHRELLKKGYEEFTRLGYRVKRPSNQGGSALPDGVAELPIRPHEAESAQKAEELRERLFEEYSDAIQLFGLSDVSLESESNTYKTPCRTLKNLQKALDSERHCVFLAPDGSWEGEDKDVDYIARRIWNIMQKPPYVRKLTDNKKIYYNNNGTPLQLNDGSIPVFKKGKGKRSIWWKDLDTGHIKMMPKGAQRPLAKFRTLADLRTPNKKKFDHHYYKKSGDYYVVEDNSGYIVDEYENESQLKNDWTTIPQPFIPEQKFPNGVPATNNWSILLFPDENRDLKQPHLYEDGELIPLYENIETTIEDYQDTDNSTEQDTLQNATDKTDTNSQKEQSAETKTEDSQTDTDTENSPDEDTTTSSEEHTEEDTEETVLDDLLSPASDPKSSQNNN